MRSGPVHKKPLGNHLRVPLACAILIVTLGNRGWALLRAQGVTAQTSSAATSARQQSAIGQASQTTPQNPPAPPEANPTAPGQKPAPSTQNPAPSAQLPEPAIKNPDVRPAPRPEIAPPALTIPRLTRAPALEDFLSMKPQGESAMQMAKVTGFVQRNPHDGAKVTEETAAYLGYDQIGRAHV